MGYTNDAFAGPKTPHLLGRSDSHYLPVRFKFTIYLLFLEILPVRFKFTVYLFLKICNFPSVVQKGDEM